MDIYVYYRVRDPDSAALEARAKAMQAALARSCGVRALLKRRPESVDGRQTWMEIYLDTGAGFEAALERAVAAAGLHSLIDGERHAEHFLDRTTCV